MRRINVDKWVKYSLILIALIIAFLFALNGRYEKQSSNYAFDKWRGKIIRLDYYEATMRRMQKSNGSSHKKNKTESKITTDSQMNTREGDKKWLYEKFSKQGLNIGSYDDFENSLNNEEDRKWYHSKAQSMGLNVGDYEQFCDLFAPKEQK